LAVILCLFSLDSDHNSKMGGNRCGFHTREPFGNRHFRQSPQLSGKPWCNLPLLVLNDWTAVFSGNGV
jgi:hypothetical protein